MGPLVLSFFPALGQLPYLPLQCFKHSYFQTTSTIVLTITVFLYFLCFDRLPMSYTFTVYTKYTYLIMPATTPAVHLHMTSVISFLLQ